MPIRAADLLNDRVLPFHAALGIIVGATLTDNGREFCGKPESHPYELLLAMEGIDHRTDGSAGVLDAHEMWPADAVGAEPSISVPASLRLRWKAQRDSALQASVRAGVVRGQDIGNGKRPRDR